MEDLRHAVAKARELQEAEAEHRQIADDALKAANGYWGGVAPGMRDAEKVAAQAEAEEAALAPAGPSRAARRATERRQATRARKAARADRAVAQQMRDLTPAEQAEVREVMQEMADDPDYLRTVKRKMEKKR